MKKLSLVSIFLKTAIALQAADSLTEIQSDFLVSDLNFEIKDRGEMYLRTYKKTGGPSAIVEGNISTFSGFIGGAAYSANYVLANNHTKCAGAR